MPLLGKEAITVAFGRDSGHKGLLFHPWLGGQRRGYIMKILHLVPLIGGKGGEHTVSSSGHISFLIPLRALPLPQNLPFVFEVLSVESADFNFIFAVDLDTN